MTSIFQKITTIKKDSPANNSINNNNNNNLNSSNDSLSKQSENKNILTIANSELEAIFLDKDESDDVSDLKPQNYENNPQNDCDKTSSESIQNDMLVEIANCDNSQVDTATINNMKNVNSSNNNNSSCNVNNGINSNTNLTQSNPVNHSSSLNSNSSTSGYATSASGRSTPYTSSCSNQLIDQVDSNIQQTNNNKTKSKIESINSLIDDLMGFNSNQQQLNSQFDLINNYFNNSQNNTNVSNSSNTHSKQALSTPLSASNTYTQTKNISSLGEVIAGTFNSNQTNLSNSATIAATASSIANNSSATVTNNVNNSNGNSNSITANSNENSRNFSSQVSFNLNPVKSSQIENNNEQSIDEPGNNTNYSNLNYLMRRDRSLDRCSVTENYMENFGLSSPSNSTTTTPKRGFIVNGNNQQSIQSPNQQYSTYVNSTLFLNNSNNGRISQQSNSQSHRHHQRSNSILNANLITSNNQLTTLNPLNFTREYGNTVVVGGGLRNSARALSSSSFSTGNNYIPPRDSSSNSINNPIDSSNAQQQQQTPIQQHSQQQQAQQQPISNSKLNFIKDLQIRLMDMQKECYFLRCELDTCQQKLASSMQSIKQFWSPELKKERQLRKEESTKYNILFEQYKLLETQYQTMLESYEQQSIAMQQLQLQLQQLQQHQTQEDLMNSSTSTKHLIKEKNLLKKTINELEMRINAQKQCLCTKDETIKKLFQLVKTLSNKTINPNTNMNEYIQVNENLNDLDLFVNTSDSSNNALNDQNQLKERLLDEERKNLQLQQYVQQIKQQHATLMNYLNQSSNKQQLPNLGENSHTMNTDLNLSFLDNFSQVNTNFSNSSTLLIEASKDNRMKQLEIQIQQLQDELNATRNCLHQKTSNENFNDLSTNNPSNSVNTTIQSNNVSPQINSHQIPVNNTCNNSNNTPSSNLPNSSNLATQIELLKTNEKFLKEKIETLKFDLSRKDTEFQQLKTKLETCESKEKDLQHYLTLLKESIVTKDQQITMQQSEVNDLRTRLREKENFIEKKNQQLQTIQLEKHQRDSDMGELRDQMDIKERKINVLNRKIDNLEEQLKDKEMQISTLRSKFNSSTSSIYHSNVMQTLEQTLEQKERLIEKLSKEAINRVQTQSRETELNEQIETLNISIKELNEKMELKNKEIQDYQNEIFYLKDELESLKTQLLRKDSHVNSLELSLTQKNEEIEMMEEKLQRLNKQQQQLAHLNTNARSQSNSNLVEIDNLKKQITNFQKDIQSKETQIQQLTTELITLKELIDDFEEQKQVLKSKLDQQQIQFSQLERQYEQTTSDYENQLKEQQNKFQEQINTLKLVHNTDMNELSNYVKDQNDIDTRLNEQRASYETEFEEQLKIAKTLQDEIETRRIELNERDQQILRLTNRLKDLEDALRESVSITAEREVVFAQQKKRTEKIEDDNKSLQEEINTMQKVLHENQLLFNRYQEELYQREEQLQKLEEEKVKEMNELLITKQEILLSTISEKDAIIAELECDKNPSNKARIQRLMDEKDNLHQQLKDLNEKRMKLMNDYMQAKDAKDKVKILSMNPIIAYDEDGVYA